MRLVDKQELKAGDHILIYEWSSKDNTNSFKDVTIGIFRHLTEVRRDANYRPIIDYSLHKFYRYKYNKEEKPIVYHNIWINGIEDGFRHAKNKNTQIFLLTEEEFLLQTVAGQI